jgi:hypothetical protein
LSHHELSFLLPHFLKDRPRPRRHVFHRVYNPVWTNPDGFSWMEVLQDESMIGLHAALTPVWSETALFADYVLPMGLAAERHDFDEPGNARRALDRVFASRCSGSRASVAANASSGPGKRIQARCGREDEFWIALVMGHRSRWQPGHPAVLRVAVSTRRAHDDRRTLSLDLREQRARACPRRARRRL